MPQQIIQPVADQDIPVKRRRTPPETRIVHLLFCLIAPTLSPAGFGNTVVQLKNDVGTVRGNKKSDREATTGISGCALKHGRNLFKHLQRLKKGSAGVRAESFFQMSLSRTQQ